MTQRAVPASRRRPRITGRPVWLAILLIGLAATSLPPPVLALDVGEKAPDFALPGTPAEPLRLSQYRGTHVVVLHFYLGDFLQA